MSMGVGKQVATPSWSVLRDFFFLSSQQRENLSVVKYQGNTYGLKDKPMRIHLHCIEHEKTNKRYFS